MSTNRASFFMVTIMFVMCSAILLGGCAGDPGPVPSVPPIRTASVAVAVGCVVDRPEEVVPMNRQVTPEQFRALAPGAMAQAVKAQAGARMNYEDRLASATFGCRDAPPK